MIAEAWKSVRPGAAVQALARGGLLAVVVYAPWAYGSTRLWTMHVLDLACLACLAFHGLGLALERRWPKWPVVPAACLAAVLAETAWMTFNAHSYHDMFFWEYVPLFAPFPHLPGSCDRAASLFYLQRQGAMFAAFLVVADMAAFLGWKRALRVTVAATGASIAVYGLAQRALGAPSIFWLREDNGGTFFGPYVYHANAGAFLNLVWPMIALAVVRSFWAPHAHLRRAAWSSALFLTFVACAVNVSRGAATVAVVLLLLGLAGLFLLRRRSEAVLSWWKPAGGVLVAVGFTAALFLNGLGSSAASRWELLRQGPPDPQRVLSYRLSLGLLPGSGWFGHGAGTFSAVFPNYDPALNGKLLGFWKFAHEDYLQTVIEYGWLGAAVWAVFLFGSLGRALWRFGGGRLRTADRLEYGVCLLALLGVALHSLIDFPLQIASLQLLVMIYTALAWVAPADEPRDGPEPKTSAAEP